MRRVRAVVTSAAMLASLAVRPATAQGGVPPQMMALETQFLRAVSQRGLDGWVAAFSDSAVIFRTDQPILRGREVIRHGMATVFSDSSVHVVWRPVGGGIAASRDVGYTFGYYRWTHRDASGTVQPLDEGKYFTVWRKESDGVWRVVFDTGSSGPVPAGTLP